MAIYVVDELSKVDDTQGVIVIRSDRQESNFAYPELQGPAARRVAIMKAAQLGLPDPRASGSASVYPVDEEGREIVDPRKQKVAAFQCDVPVTRRLV
jgi:hypothetical protein